MDPVGRMRAALRRAVRTVRSSTAVARARRWRRDRADDAPEIAREAERFSHQDNRRRRELVWTAIPYFREQIAASFDLHAHLREHLAGRDELRALTLACGDMSGEYRMFRRLGVGEIDAFDVSPGQREKFYRDVFDGSAAVTYTIADVNTIELPRHRYDVVYLQHAYHHVVRLEHVAGELRTALKPDGVLAIVDYIGANRLQRTPRQRDLCGAIWRALPERYRVRPNGRVFAELRIPDPKKLSPYEAVRSEEILGVLDDHFEPIAIYLYGGILFPLFNGTAQNYTNSPADQALLRVMWDLDRWLLDHDGIEPNFVQALYRPRPKR